MSPAFRDQAERAVATFIEAFLGVFCITDASSVEAASAAGAAAVLALVKAWSKGVLGRNRRR
jgi:hypothetical protein